LKIYIGKTKTNDLSKYLQHKFTYSNRDRAQSSHLFNAIRKYGREHFHIFSLFEGTTNEEICDHEKLLIKTLGTQHSDIGYNICGGGEGFTGTHSAETLRKMSASHKGHPTAEETRRKISKTHKENFSQGFVSGKQGWVTPPETRAKQSASNKGKHRDILMLPKVRAKCLVARQKSLKEHGGSFLTPAGIAKIRAAHLGKKASPETRQRMREAHLGQVPWNKGEHTKQTPWNKGKKMSEEYRKNAGNAFRGKTHSVETRSKMSVSHSRRTLSDTQFAVRLEASNRSRHARWHVNRGISKLDCKFCLGNS
jgi:hypothetical protein